MTKVLDVELGCLLRATLRLQWVNPRVDIIQSLCFLYIAHQGLNYLLLIMTVKDKHITTVSTHKKGNIIQNKGISFEYLDISNIKLHRKFSFENYFSTQKVMTFVLPCFCQFNLLFQLHFFYFIVDEGVIFVFFLSLQPFQ